MSRQSHTSSLTPFAVVGALLVTMMLVTYAGGYFVLGSERPIYFTDACEGPWIEIGRTRHFRSWWLAAFYEPMGKAESWWRGEEVELVSP